MFYICNKVFSRYLSISFIALSIVHSLDSTAGETGTSSRTKRKAAALHANEGIKKALQFSPVDETKEKNEPEVVVRKKRKIELPKTKSPSDEDYQSNDDLSNEEESESHNDSK